MIDKVLNKLIQFGLWIGETSKRIHWFFICLDFFVLVVLVIFSVLCYHAIRDINQSAPIIETPRLSFLMGFSPLIWVIHLNFYLISRGKIKIQNALSYFLPCILPLAITLGITLYIDQQAKSANYILCHDNALSYFEWQNQRVKSKSHCEPILQTSSIN